MESNHKKRKNIIKNVSPCQTCGKKCMNNSNGCKMFHEWFARSFIKAKKRILKNIKDL